MTHGRPVGRRTPLKRHAPTGPRTPHVTFRSPDPARNYPCTCGVLPAHQAAQWHHWLERRKLREHVRSMRLEPRQARKVLSGLLHDPRNLSPYAFDCHIGHRFTRADVPESAWEFAAEHNLTVVLERSYPL